MPAIGKITLDIKDYESALSRARAEGKKFASGSEQDFRQVGKGASKAGSIISSISSEAGGAFGKLGSIIGAVASGPVVALTAALGALVAVGVELWDRMTLSAEEYAHKLDLASQAAEKNRDAVEKQTAEDSGYMERLQELASKEKLSNEAKTEAATLIKNLTSRYGDLGISIDEVTGRIKGADEAQKKFLERQKEMRMKALREQMTATRKQALSQARMNVLDSEFLVSNKKSRDQMSNVKYFMSGPLASQLFMAEKYRDTAKTKSEMDNWQKLVDILTKLKQMRQEYNQLSDTGTASEKELNNQQRKQSDKTQQKLDEELKAKKQLEQKTEDYYSGSIEKLRQELELQKLINEGKTEEAARQKLLNDLKQKGLQADSRVGTILSLQNQLGSARLTQAQGKQAGSLYDRALRAAGRGQEADTRAALMQAEQSKGGKLTEEEKRRTLDLLSLTQQLDKLSGAGFQGMAIQTNSLTARGGFQTGAVAPDAEKYNRIIADNGKTILSVVQRIETICREFGKF